MKNNALNISDLIATGVYSAVYFIFVTMATFASGIFIPVFSMIMIPAMASLISGAIYMVLALKVRKFGALTIMGCVMGVFYFFSGHFSLLFLPSIIFAVVADFIAFKGAYRSKVLLTISYVVFGFGNAGPILPLYFAKEIYVQNLIERGKDNAYISELFAQISVASFVLFVVSIVIAGILGAVFAQKILKKHFVKAGVV